jgi:pSer/pThr/pTyr-binding forkhead associated (FHA) protein
VNLRTPIALPALHRLAHKNLDPDEGTAAALGPAVFLGTVPTDDVEAWSYRTAQTRALPPSADGAGLSSATLAWPIRKQNPHRSFKDVVLLGRASSNDIVVRHRQVSKLHARLRVVDGDVLVMDANSANGTFVNGNDIKGTEITLKDGDAVIFGAVALTFLRRATLWRVLSAQKELR